MLQDSNSEDYSPTFLDRNNTHKAKEAMRHPLEIIADQDEDEDKEESIPLNDDGNVLMSQESFAVLSPRMKRHQRKELPTDQMGIKSSGELRKFKLQIGIRKSMSMEQIEMFREEDDDLILTDCCLPAG